MLHVQVKKHIDSLSDETLYQYATDTEGKYADDAVAYAKELVATRKFDRQQIAALEESKQEQAQHEASQQAEAANVPLSGGMRVCFFLMGMLGFPLVYTVICYQRFQERGQKKRVKQMFVTMVAGFLTLIVLVGVIALLLSTSQTPQAGAGPRLIRY